VEVTGSEVLVSYPFSFLGEKLSDAQRWVEIQDSFGEVFGVDCRVKLVLAADYRPGEAAAAAEPSPAPATQPDEAPPVKADAAAPPQPGEADTPSPAEAQALDKISAWARKHGGHTTIVPT
jgi:hypothetical protein